jgi:hypothetical protein
LINMLKPTAQVEFIGYQMYIHHNIEITNYKSQITNKFQITMTEIPNKRRAKARSINFI